jgi:hypothetical protein
VLRGQYRVGWVELAPQLRFLAHNPRFPVAISKRSHPIPFRTRKLSSSEPMVLLGRLSGRVGRCRDYFNRRCNSLRGQGPGPHSWAGLLPFVLWKRWRSRASGDGPARFGGRGLFRLFGPSSVRWVGSPSPSSCLVALSFFGCPHTAAVPFPVAASGARTRLRFPFPVAALGSGFLLPGLGRGAQCGLGSVCVGQNETSGHPWMTARCRELAAGAALGPFRLPCR